MLKVQVFCRSELIGRCDLYALDPPMGVVSGELEPTPAYGAIRAHFDAAFRGVANWDSLRLEIVTEDGSLLSAVGGVMIEDLIDRASEPPNLVVCGVDAQPTKFDEWFGADPNYLNYYGR